MMRPRFHRLQNGELKLQQSKESEKHKVPKTPPEALSEVREAAVAAVRRNGGDVNDNVIVTGHFVMQFGKYHGKTYKWILENDLGYAAYLTASCQQDQQKLASDNSSMTPHDRQKFSFMGYALKFPEMKEALELKKRVARPRRIAAKQKPRATAASSTADDIDAATESEMCSQAEAMERAHSSGTASMQCEHGPICSESSSRCPLPKGWRNTLPAADHAWVLKALFKTNAKTGKQEIDFSKIDRQWWRPPPTALCCSQVPQPSRYFAQPLLLWMPRRLWKFELVCGKADCKEKLTSAGLYQTVRQVLDVDCYYSMATEYLECKKCGKIPGWSSRVLNQLDVAHRSQFPVLLTYKYACDVKVVRPLRQRTLGNSSTLLYKTLSEQHTERWYRQVMTYLADCEPFKNAYDKGMVSPCPTFHQPPEFKAIPTAQWLLTVYVQDILSRLDEIKASITSTFGSVLKMDSTKKVTKKLAGHSHGTAAWATNVGNEHGQVLMSVLTAAEGHGLDNMISGLMKRYEDAEVEAPQILYVDRGCCGHENQLVRKQFRKWPNLIIRLDIWHLMRRFANACTTNMHPLYAEFMARLSQCIFIWSAEDLRLLKSAKRAEMEKEGILDPSDEDVIGRITKRELALHCRRKTRDAEDATTLLHDMMASFSGSAGNDTLGVPLLDSSKVLEIWGSQKQHLQCIQDPDIIPLYVQTGTIVKGGIKLPVYRCARGSTSLESFHLHLNRFIPGQCASGTHFQAYLLEGLFRWNKDRAIDATADGPSRMRSYSNLLAKAVNTLGQKILGSNLCPPPTAMGAYTGELIGVEYLYDQTGKALYPVDEPDIEIEESEALFSREEDDADEGDEGIVEDMTVAPSAFFTAAEFEVTNVVASTSTDVGNTDTGIGEPSESIDSLPSTSQMDTSASISSSAVGPRGIQGYDAVCQLATELVSLHKCNGAIPPDQVQHIISLWENLDPYDRRPINFTPIYKKSRPSGKYKAVKSKNSVTPGVEATQKNFVGSGSGVARKPDETRYLEETISKLCDLFPGLKPVPGEGNRWDRISKAYKNIRYCIVNNSTIMLRTRMQLPDMNRKTILTWFTKRQSRMDVSVLKQGLPEKAAAPASTEAVPPAASKPASLSTANFPQNYIYVLPPNAAGTAMLRRDPPRPTEDSPCTSTAPKIPRSTQCYRRKREAMEASGGVARRRYKQRTGCRVCSKCGKDRDDKETHKSYYGNTFCSATSTVPHEVWLNDLKAKGYGKKKKD